MAVHDVRDAALTVQARPRANQLEADFVAPLRQPYVPAESRGQRSLDDRRLLPRVEHTIDPETLDMVGDKFGGHDAVRSPGYSVYERAADDEDERGGEGEGTQRRSAEAPRYVKWRSSVNGCSTSSVCSPSVVCSARLQPSVQTRRHAGTLRPQRSRCALLFERVLARREQIADRLLDHHPGVAGRTDAQMRGYFRAVGGG